MRGVRGSNIVDQSPGASCQCKHCGIEKKIGEFSIHSRYLGKLLRKTICKKCDYRRSRQWKLDHPEQAKTTGRICLRRWRERNRVRINAMARDRTAKLRMSKPTEDLKSDFSCVICNVTKPASQFYIYKKTSGKFYRYKKCKACCVRLALGHEEERTRRMISVSSPEILDRISDLKAAGFKITSSSIYGWRKTGLPSRSYFTKAEDSVIHNMVSSRHTTRQIATILNLPLCSVRARISALGLSGRRKAEWSDIICANKLCGKVFRMRTSVLAHGRRFCSCKCFSESNKKSGSRPNLDRGREWTKIRDTFLTLWTICSRCAKHGIRLNVHHIIPYRLTQNNDYHNLIVLCDSCHKMVENATIKFLNTHNNSQESQDALYVKLKLTNPVFEAGRAYFMNRYGNNILEHERVCHAG